MFFVQEPIGKPMLMTIAKKYKKEAVDIFKSVLVYMGDRASKSRTEDVVLLELSMCPCKVKLLILILIISFVTFSWTVLVNKGAPR